MMVVVQEYRVLLSQSVSKTFGDMYMHVLSCFFLFLLFFSFFASLRCFALYYTVLYCLNGE